MLVSKVKKIIHFCQYFLVSAHFWHCIFSGMVLYTRHFHDNCIHHTLLRPIQKKCRNVSAFLPVWLLISNISKISIDAHTLELDYLSIDNSWCGRPRKLFLGFKSQWYLKSLGQNLSALPILGHFDTESKGIHCRGSSLRTQSALGTFRDRWRISDTIRGQHWGQKEPFPIKNQGPLFDILLGPWGCRGWNFGGSSRSPRLKFWCVAEVQFFLPKKGPP